MPGLPNSRLIPDSWEIHHTGTAEQAMTAECVATRLTAPTAGTYNPGTGRSTYPTPTTVYTGPCRLQRSALTGATAPLVGEKVTPLRQYTLSTPLAAALLHVNDVITVTAATDPEQVNLRLRITDVRGGTLLWQRDYLCETHTPTTR